MDISKKAVRKTVYEEIRSYAVSWTVFEGKRVMCIQLRYEDNSMQNIHIPEDQMGEFVNTLVMTLDDIQDVTQELPTYRVRFVA